MFVAVSMASPTVPAWVAVSGTISSIITAIGVMIAGSFAYFKFVKGRTFYPRGTTGIDCKLVRLNKANILQVTISLRNDSQIAILFPELVPQILVIGEASDAILEQACDQHRAVEWENTRQTTRYLNVPDGAILSPIVPTVNPPWWWWLTRAWYLGYLRGEKLEPGEQWARTTLVPVAPDSVAFLLHTELNACRHVAVRHVISHKRRCCRDNSTDLNFWQDFCVLTGRDKDDLLKPR
jgi:hypothetical protein